MIDNFRQELQKFDAERVLPAWDGLLMKQQTTLESLGVPTMFPTMTAGELQVPLYCKLPLNCLLMCVNLILDTT